MSYLRSLSWLAWQHADTRWAKRCRDHFGYIPGWARWNITSRQKPGNFS